MQNVANAPLNITAQQASLSSASIVTISTLGNLLSTAANIGDSLSQQAGNLPPSFDNFITNIRSFVDALNRFLASGSNSLQNSTGASFVNQFMQMISSSTTATTGNTSPLFPALASLGITYQTPLLPGMPSQMNLDAQVLQSVFNANSVGTASLMGQAFQSIGQFTANLANQFLRLESNLAQASATQSTLNATGTISATQTSMMMTTTIASPNMVTAPNPPAVTTPQANAPVSSNLAPLTSSSATVVTPATSSPAVTATPTTTPASMAQTTAPSKAIPTFNITSDSSMAAAVAAYNLMSGMLDTGRTVPTRRLPATSYSSIWPIAKVQPVAPGYSS